MPETIVTNKVLQESSAAMESMIPLLGMANRKLEKDFAEGEAKGDTAWMKISGYGTTYRKMDISSETSDIEVTAVPLTITPARTPADYTKINEMLKYGNFDRDVIRQFAAGHAYTLGLELSDALSMQATQAVISTSAASANLIGAVTGVRETMMAGQLYGCLNVSQMGIYADAMKTSFGNSEGVGGRLYKTGMLGRAFNIEWAESVSNIVETSAIFPAGTMTITTTVDANGVGTTTATFTATSAPGSSSVVKKGTKISLGTGTAQVKAVGEMGRVFARKRIFTVMADVTIPTTANTTPVPVNLGTVYFTGAKKNVSVTAISAVAVVNEMEANSQYYVGCVWNQNELLAGVKAFSPFPSKDSKSISGGDGFPLRLTTDSNVSAGTIRAVLDNMFGCTLYTGRSACAIVLKVS